MKYKDQVRVFDVRSRPLLQYFLDQASDPILARQAEWHSMRVTTQCGGERIPVYGEPVTGERAYTLEVNYLFFDIEVD